MTRNLNPLEAVAFVEFKLQEVVPKLYEKIGDTLFDSLFLAEEVAGIAKIMETFDSMNAIPLHYLENLFSKPSYLRGLKYIKKIPLGIDESSLDLLMMEELPQNKIPIKGKLYLKNNGNKVEYTVMAPNGKVVNELLDIDIGETLTSSTLKTQYGTKTLKPKILRETSKRGHTPIKGTDQTTLLLHKTFEDLWLAFKAMPFLRSHNLSMEDQRYYNILLKGTEKSYQPMATLFAMNKFTFSYFETFLPSIRFDQFDEKRAEQIFFSELGNDFIEHSIKNFLSLVKTNLPTKTPKNIWEHVPNPLWKIEYEYQSSKEKSLDPNDQLIFRAYSNWLSKFIS